MAADVHTSYGTQPANAEGEAPARRPELLHGGGKDSGGKACPYLGKQYVRQRRLAERRVAMLAVFLALGLLVLLIATKINPESAAEEVRQNQHLAILERTLFAIENFWLKQGIADCVGQCKDRYAANNFGPAAPVHVTSMCMRECEAGRLTPWHPRPLDVLVSVDSSSSASETLQGGGRGARRQLLADVFTAPLDMASGLVDRALKIGNEEHQSLADCVTTVTGCGKESDDFMTKVNGVGRESDGYVTKVNGVGQESDGYVTKVNAIGKESDGYVTKINGVGQENDGYVTKVNVNAVNYNDVVTQVSNPNYLPSTGMVTNVNSRGIVHENGEVWTTPTLDVNGQRVGGGSGARVQAGPLYKVPGGFETSNYVPAKPPSGFGFWSAPAGWEDGKADRQFSITIDTPCGVSPAYPCQQQASARLNLEVYCPPYKAPAHGSVWYKGREYRDTTLHANITNRKVWKVEDKALPIAQYGDIPAGQQVRISCDVHYCLSEKGLEMPKCLLTGKWEAGKTCDPIMCDAYVPPPHALVVPARPVMAGEQVTIYCEEGYDEYYGADETRAKAKKDGATRVRLVHTDPWYDFSRWFGGPNQGRKGHLISMEAGPQTARATVQALRGKHSGFRAEEQPAAIAVSKSLSKVQKKLAALAEERKALQKRITLSQGITHMSARDVDNMVESFVKAGGIATSTASTASTASTSSISGAQPPRDRQHGRRLLWGPGGGQEEEEKAHTEGGESAAQVERLRKNPVCLDASRASASVSRCSPQSCCGHYEPGIYCKKRAPPVVVIPSPPPPPSPGVPPPPPVPQRPRGGRIAPPRGRYIVPLVCPSYIAPDHGSVWFRGQEFRIATNAGIPASESVKITCHKHYKLTQIGSDRPACLPNGQWEVGKMCEPIYCGDYGSLEYGHVSTHDNVRAGTRILLTCHAWYQPAGIQHGATCRPMCLDDGTFEKGCLCVPKPCPVGSSIDSCGDAAAIASEGIGTKVSPLYVRDWEQEVEKPMANDYTPNVFDQEPRPWTLDTPLDRHDTLLRPIDSRRVNFRDTTRSWTKWSPAPNEYDGDAGLWRAREGRVGAGGDRGFVEDETTRYGGEALGGSQTGNRGHSEPGASVPGGKGTWPNAPPVDRPDWEEGDD